MRTPASNTPTAPDNVEKAVTDLKSLVAADPKNAVWHFDLGRGLAAKGDLGEARTQFLQAIVNATEQILLNPPQADQATRAALFRAYMDWICGRDFILDPAKDFLAGSDPKGKGDYQGCGEFNPLLLFSGRGLETSKRGHEFRCFCGSEHAE